MRRLYNQIAIKYAIYNNNLNYSRDEVGHEMDIVT